jgi:hypothetical protein
MNDVPDDDRTVGPSAAPARGPQSFGSDAATAGPTQTSTQALPLGARVDEFEIRGILGQGGFSFVYLAWDHSLHRNVALKEYLPVDLAMRDDDQSVTVRSTRHREIFQIGLRSFINEARLLASFDHPSLVKVHRFWEERGTAYIVMPWYDGPTLKKALAASASRPGEAWLRRLLASLTEGIGVLHARDCFHRDIAPDNIVLIGPQQLPLLLDFGAARRVIGDLTHDLTAILKHGYAPIEQYGDIPGTQQGPWTDVYALAAVIHFAIRGKTPPPAVGRLVTDTYQPLATSGMEGFSAVFLAAIDRALIVRPEQRTQSIAAFREQLGLDRLPPATASRAAPAAVPDVVDDVSSAPTVFVPPARSRRPSAAALSIAGAGALALVLAAGAWLTLRAREPLDAHASAARSPPAASSVAVARVEVERSATPPSAVPTSVALAAETPATASSAGSDRKPAVLDESATRSASAAAAAAELDAATRERDVAAEREARRIAVATLETLQRLAKSENRDVSSAVAAVREQLKRAQVESTAGRHDKAAALSRDGSALAAQALNGLINELVKGYRTVGEQATQLGDQEIARQAGERANAVAALRRSAAR